MALAFVVTGTIWRWMLQPQGGLNVLPTLLGLPQGDFRWLASRTQIWQFNWQNLPFWVGILVSIILLWITVSALRHGDTRRSLIMGTITALLAVLTFTGGRRLELLPFAETHGFNLAFIGIILAAVWQMSGYTMALYLAGLRGVSDELREAARVDGATEVQLYRFGHPPAAGPHHPLRHDYFGPHQPQDF